jgi:carboxyl-terminal processing protease
MKKIRNLFLILSLMAIVSLVSFKAGEKNVSFSSGENSQLDLNLMWKVKNRLSGIFLEKDKVKNDKQLVYGAIKGMVDSLGDPYTVFLPPQENKSLNEDLNGQFGGVGISLGYKDKTLAVMSPLPKTPAAKAGVLAGDLILKITDKDNKIDRETTDMSLDEAVNLIRGKVGSEVTLKMFREGKKESFDVVLKRDNIEVPSVELEWKDQNNKKVAWVKLYKFTDKLYEDWPKIVDQIVAEENKNKEKFGGIVLDLRNNPGGFLQTSVLVGSDFVKDGVLVKQQSSDGTTESYGVDKNRGKLLNEKMVVLINGGSASASEILAGALKDYKRAILVGEKSFGKGTVQQPEDFSDGSGLHVTIAKWLLPSGKNIHKVGIDPDTEVKFVANDKDPKADNQLDKAIEVLLGK